MQTDNVEDGQMKAKRLILRNCLESVLFIIFVGPFFQATVYAGVENRPINTDDAHTLEKGTLTTSLGTAFTRGLNGDKETDLNLNLGYGITDRFEITADIPFAFLDLKEGDDAEGLGDISIRPEILLIEEKKSIPAISFATTFKTHSGNKDGGLGSGENDYSLSLQWSKDFNLLKCHFNIGYTFVGQPEGEAVDDIIFFNFASEYNLNAKLSLVGEVIGDTNSDPNDNENPFEGLIGFIYSINNNLALDLGIGGGFTNASPDIRATSGLTYQF